ncbi:transcription antitermination factor NusB [Hyphomicrobium sp.]|uniref:transcription antitermination factor NusB n=1 Tax=Hyphomicrobium sp. TaxID=82 RepID=UPI002E372527|nr:transcription antitermination factor NusB [Hyphomicrobium sp.]HEX2842667.1 transcription antitermination factor NusB [Hyphomicrobium sp.]
MSLPRKKKTAGDAPKPRTISRMAAVQALYQMDLAGTDAGEVIEQFTALPPEPGEGDTAPESEVETLTSLEGGDATFFADVVKGVVRRQREIDPLVDQQLRTGWRLVRVDSILRAILRGGVFELLERSDVPARVTINEYINIAKAFFEEDEPKVVNGVLDRIAHKVRAKEFEAPGEGG